jgi:PAS domain S-box-containing protein
MTVTPDMNNSASDIINNIPSFDIIENLQEVFYHSDLEGNILDLSPSFKLFLDFDRDELIGSSVYNLYHNYEDRAVLIDNLKKNGQIRNYELRLKSKTNKIKHVSISAHTVLDEAGEPNYISGTIRDITERKLAEAALLENKIKYELLVTNSPDAIIIYQNGIIVFVNNESLLLFAATCKEELIGKPVLGFVHPNYQALVIERMKSLASHRSTLPVLEEKFIRLDGSEIDVEVNAMPITMDSEPAVQLIIHNITDRKKSEKALLILAKAIHNSGEAIFLTDRNGVFTFINPAFTKLYGFSSEEIVGKKTPRIIKSEISDASVYEYFWQTLLKGEEVRGEMINKGKDGMLIDIDGSATPIIDDEKKIIGFLGIQRDISQRKRAEQELVLAKEKAEESNRLKTAFLNNISHEIRTPFNGILGFLSILLENDLTDNERVEYVKIINSSSFRLMDTINNLVEISKIQVGQIELSLSDTIIKNMSYDLYDSFKGKTESKGLGFTINYKLSNEDEVIFTDLIKLNAVLTNVLDNAIKFTDQGAIEFDICKIDDYLLFSVKDTGVGIPENKRATIFELFIHAEGTNHRLFEGLGLGLCIAKSYVDMFGGKIWADSEVGKGSIFYVSIPFENTRKTLDVTQYNLSTKTTENQRKGLKILIAEDDKNSLELIEYYVRRISKEILIARNGAQAVEIFRQNPDIDLILMDIRMPKMDGCEATRQIRLLNPKVIIIAQTAYSIKKDQEDAIAAGCNDYILKPLFSKNLKTLLEKYF